MSRTKRMLSLLLSLLMVLSVFPLGITASAEGKKVEYINDFSANTVLTYKQYYALRNGDYCAEQINGTWYYSFESDELIVKVPVQVFYSSTGNNYDNLNNQLTKDCLKKAGDTSKKTYIYKSYYGSTNAGHYSIHHLYLCCLNATCWMDNNQTIVCESKMNGQILFSFYDQVPQDREGHCGPPSTRAQFERALKRDSADSHGCYVTPEFTVEITQPGSNQVYLNTFYVCGMGANATEKADIRSLVSEIKTYAKLFKSAGEMVAAPNIKSLFDLVSVAVPFMVQSKGKEYNTGRSVKLSENGNYSLAAKFTSPLPFCAYKDWVQFIITLSDDPTPTGTNGIETKAAVRFEIVSFGVK